MFEDVQNVIGLQVLVTLTVKIMIAVSGIAIV
jgi:hypothetical protein